MRITGGGYGEDRGLYGGQTGRPGGMMGPGRVENSPDGGRSVIMYGYQQLPKPLDKDQASQEVENYLRSTGNPNLKLGEVREKGENFEADIVTKNDSLLDKILVNKHTGEMRSEY